MRSLLHTFNLLMLSFAVTFCFAVTANAQTVTSDKDDYAPGEIAHITGTGWTADDSVHVEFKETPDYPDYHIYDIKVNADGTWQIDYQIEQRHLGVAFTVVAVGKQSAYRATTIFTDGNVNYTTSGLPTGISGITGSVIYTPSPNGTSTISSAINLSSSGNQNVTTVQLQQRIIH